MLRCTRIIKTYNVNDNVVDEKEKKKQTEKKVDRSFLINNVGILFTTKSLSFKNLKNNTEYYDNFILDCKLTMFNVKRHLVRFYKFIESDECSNILIEILENKNKLLTSLLTKCTIKLYLFRIAAHLRTLYCNVIFNGSSDSGHKEYIEILTKHQHFHEYFKFHHNYCISCFSLFTLEQPLNNNLNLFLFSYLNVLLHYDKQIMVYEKKSFSCLSKILNYNNHGCVFEKIKSRSMNDVTKW
jgi:hypothetical protein